MEDYTPLAERMRPKTLDEVAGQEHLTGKNGILRRMLARDFIPSMLFWGPPGSGKTTLAKIIAKQSGRPFYALSAVSSGVKDIKQILAKHPKSGLFSKAPVVFIDEIHRFNKAQQDALLEAVETGQIILIGATTENPGFEVNNALLSRMHTFVLYPLEESALRSILKRVMAEDEYLKRKNITKIDEESLIAYSGGDVRKMLNLLEAVVWSSDKKEITREDIKEAAKVRPAMYDKKSDWHYDIISAFIKSIRGSDPDAALYWLARMLGAGEDPVFIARRLVISAAEDIGLANPNALLIANAAFDAVNKIGMPEAKIILSEAVIYLAASPKSNSAYKAIKAAEKKVRETGDLDVPLHLRNAVNSFMKKQGYGREYKYPHGYPGNFVNQHYWPSDMEALNFYVPQENPREIKMKEFLKKKWKYRYGGQNNK